MKSETRSVLLELGGVIGSAAAMVKEWPPDQRQAKFTALLAKVEDKRGLTDVEKEFWRSALICGWCWFGLLTEVLGKTVRRRKAEAALMELLGRTNGT